MAEYIRKGNGRIDVKFHAPIKSFKRVETFKHRGSFYKIYVNKNDSVYNLERTNVVSWKEVVKGKKKLRVPDVVEAIPEPGLLNKVRGNSYSIAIRRITAWLEKDDIL
jgi:hypothetical protein